jgi:hypothetical protein
MLDSNNTDRIVFLAKQFDVFDDSTDEHICDKIKTMSEYGNQAIPFFDVSCGTIAIQSCIENENGCKNKKISVSSSVFANMITADPTEKKIYLQWLLNVFVRHLKSDKETDIKKAFRFVSEDLPQANKYLKIFEENKRKKKFKDLCLSSYSLKNIIDPTNINQYKSLSQLFDAVDPFIEKEPSSVERTIQKFVESGQAEIPVKDRNYTLFIPKTRAANVVFDNFSNWCTAKEGNGMFKNYTQNNRKPNGKYSDIYIIINNNFFKGETDEMYQIHFETGQIKDRRNSDNVSIFENVLSNSDGLSNFFYDELIKMAKEYKKSIETNKYLDFLIKFGFAESLFELYDVNVPTIKIINKEIPRLPDMNKFSMLDQLIIIDSGLVELHPSIGNLSNLEMLVLPNNKIKKLPSEIGKLKNLLFLNIMDNKIKEIPDEISFLDKSNGGSLHRIAVKIEDVGETNYKKLKKLLPETLMN